MIDSTLKNKKSLFPFSYPLKNPILPAHDTPGAKRSRFYAVANFHDDIFLKSLRLRKALYGENSPSVFTAMNNLANLYIAIGNYDKAEKMLEDALEKFETLSIEKSAIYAGLISQKASLYEYRNKNEEAAGIYKEELGEDHPEYILLLSNIVYINAMYLEKSSFDVENAWFDIMSRRGKVLGTTHPDYIGTVHNLAAYYLLIFKYWKCGPLLEKNLEMLEETGNILEKKILTAVKGYNQTQQDFSLEWQDIQRELQGDEVAVEFVDFTVMTRTYSMCNYYAAIVLTPGKELPEVISLCCFDDLYAAVQEYPHDFKALYKLIWKPLEKHLKNKRSIYIAPTGLLHKVSFAGIQKKNYDIHTILSTKDIPALKKREYRKMSSSKAVLFGGVDFDMAKKDTLDTRLATDSDLDDESLANLTRSIINDYDPIRRRGFSYLLGSRKEVQAIDSILNALEWSVELYIDSLATKSRFRSSASLSPDAIHVSTHGFYYAKPERPGLGNNHKNNPYIISDNPLMRSGLALAGANHIWGKEEVAGNIDDGILTAYEISNMDLSNTKLVVLSACKTGLGDIIGNEGIYGLQRAIRQAGAEFMIVSLWDIEDNVALEFMKEFYASWTDSGEYDIRRSFYKAQSILKAKYLKYSEKWAGFILIE